MSSAPKARVQQLSAQLNESSGDGGSFEGMPSVRTIAGDSRAPRVKGKVVIVTGTNSLLGIGRAAAHLFAQSGAKAIFICDLNTENLEKHKRELNSLYPSTDVYVQKVDVGEEANVESVVNLALEKYGRLDVFFANGGVSIGTDRILDANVNDFMQTMKTNALSVFLAAKHGARGMLQTSDEKQHPGGSIIATASTAGIRSNAGPTAYSASKSAVISIVQTACYQLAGTGIRCNALCPGIIETGMTSKMYEAARARGTDKKIGQLNPLQRGGVADEVARVALFLASDEASYVNGQAWAVDGGLSAGHPFVPGKMA